ARARQAGAAIDHAPAVALAVRDSGVAAEPHLAVRAVDHVAGDPRAGMTEREPGGEVLDARRAGRQPPDAGRRADPQRACAIAHPPPDAPAAAPDARQLAPLAVAAAHPHAALVADDEPARIGPQRLHRGGAGPAGGADERALAVAHVQPARRADPQPAASARD